MIKDTNRIIDERASECLRAALAPHEWQIYCMGPDIAKDYVVELVDGGKYLGLSFIVQLKGQEKVRLSRGRRYASFRIETKYLAYFLKLRQPVFLVLIEVTTGIGYWVFLQKYLQEGEGGWQQKKQVTIHIPVDQVLSDTRALRIAVQDADLFMAATHPHALPGAVVAAQEHLERLDPRFCVKLTASESTKSFVVEAKEPVDVTFSLKGDRESVISKLHDLFGKGEPISVQPGEVEVVGSPLIAYAVQRAVKIHCSHTRSGVCVIREVGLDGHAHALGSVPVKLEGGTDEIRLIVDEDPGPLYLRMTLSRLCRRLNANLSLKLSRWVGLSLQKLPMFNEVLGVARAADRGSGISLELIFPDSVPVTFTMTGEELRSGTLQHQLEILQLIQKARRVLDIFGQDRMLPYEISAKQWRELERLHQLGESGEIAFPAPNAEVKMVLGRRGAASLLNQSRSNPVGSLLFTAEKHETPFLGQPLELGPVSVSYSEMKLVNQAALRDAIGKRSEDVEAVLAGTSDTTLTFRRQASATPCGASKR